LAAAAPGPEGCMPVFFVRLKKNEEKSFDKSHALIEKLSYYVDYEGNEVCSCVVRDADAFKKYLDENSAVADYKRLD
jgi:hypothetical protein